MYLDKIALLESQLKEACDLERGYVARIGELERVLEAGIED